MRSWSGAVVASVAVALAGCSLYFEQDDDDDTTVADAGRIISDADPFAPDAAWPSPDARPCQTVDEFLAAFGECMSFDDWQVVGMCDVPNESTASGTCADCHADGTGGIFLATNCEDTFTSTRVKPYILGLVKPSADAAGCFNALAVGSWVSYNDPGHPTYTFSDAHARAINDFFSYTYARYADPDFVCTP